jgi:hypothetical protein
MRDIWTGKHVSKLAQPAAVARPIHVAAAPDGVRLAIRTPSSLRREVCR